MLFEVVELGISGSKSRSNAGIVLKSEKELKPASMRVREAAESLLNCLMNHLGYCPPAPCPPDSIIGTFMLDEITVLKQLKIAHNVMPDDAHTMFKYFVVDSSLIIAVLKESLANKTAMIVRSAFGKYGWSLNSQLVASNAIVQPHPELVPRPACSETISTKHKFSFKYFPDSVERIPLTKLLVSIIICLRV